MHSVLINVLGCKIPFSCTVLYLGYVSLIALRRDQHLVKIPEILAEMFSVSCPGTTDEN